MTATAIEALTQEITSPEQEELTPTGRKKRGKNKWKRGELKAYREEKKRKKLNAAQIEALTNEMHEIMLKIWEYKYGGKAGSLEHLKLREELHVLFDKRKALGYDSKTVYITDEDRIAAKRYKERKKKERELKKLAQYGNQKITRRRTVVETEEDEDDE